MAASVGYDGLATGIDSAAHHTYKPHGALFSIGDMEKQGRITEGLLNAAAGVGLDAMAGKGAKWSDTAKRIGELKNDIAQNEVKIAEHEAAVSDFRARLAEYPEKAAEYDAAKQKYEADLAKHLEELDKYKSDTQKYQAELEKHEAEWKQYEAELAEYNSRTDVINYVQFKDKIFENLGDALPDSQKTLVVTEIMNAAEVMRSYDLKKYGMVLTRVLDDSFTKSADGLSKVGRIERQIAEFKNARDHPETHTSEYQSVGQAKKDPYTDPTHPRPIESELSKSQPEIKSIKDRPLETCGEHEAVTLYK